MHAASIITVYLIGKNPNENPTPNWFFYDLALQQHCVLVLLQ
jgi:hypothetical protein